MGYEIEMKLQMKDKTVQTALLYYFDEAPYASFRENLQMRAIYFDTADGRLRKKRLAYRVRRENGRFIATLKGGGSAAGGMHKRAEFNADAISERPDLTVFYKTDGETLAKKLLALLGDAPLIELVRTEFHRAVYDWREGETAVEAALDAGWVYGGKDRQKILELELELKEGQEDALRSLGERLSRRFSLTPAGESKFSRGLALWEGIRRSGR